MIEPLNEPEIAYLADEVLAGRIYFTAKKEVVKIAFRDPINRGELSGYPDGSIGGLYGYTDDVWRYVGTVPVFRVAHVLPYVNLSDFLDEIRYKQQLRQAG